MLYNLLKVKQLISHGAGLQIQAICDFNHYAIVAS